MITRMHEALRTKRNDLDNDQKGFTLVELLVVVLIIGILAAIAIPFFLNQRQGAWEAQVKSDIANAVIAAETLAISQNGSYLTLTDVTAKANGYQATDKVKLVFVGTANQYTITGTHEQYAGLSIAYSSATGKSIITKTP